MKHYSKSYNPGACCGDGCTYAFLSTEEKPCWGDVEVVDEQCNEDFTDCEWIHACEGHRELADNYNNDYYIPELNV